MERTLSVEEKIRRAEEIYERRKKEKDRPIATLSVNNKKDMKLLRKMIIQILICLSIYLIIYVIKNNNYVFSEDVIDKIDEIISRDINFQEIYESIKTYSSGMFNKDEEITPPDEGIGGAEENTEKKEEAEQDNTLEQPENQTQELSQAEQDIINVKNTTSFIKPIEGVISSKYGWRDTATGRVPKNHTGTDIAANLGTKIKASTDGEVVLASEEGDYRKAFKDSNRRS